MLHHQGNTGIDTDNGGGGMTKICDEEWTLMGSTWAMDDEVEVMRWRRVSTIMTAYSSREENRFKG